MAGYIFKKGRVGITSRNGTLTHEVVNQVSEIGIGQSTSLGIGGDPIAGLSFVEILRLFQVDPDTDAVVMIGEIGGTQKEETVRFHRIAMTKPLIAFIAGVTAPPDRQLGHAGAIITGGVGGAARKIEALEVAGVKVLRNPAEVGWIVASALAKRGLQERGVDS